VSLVGFLRFLAYGFKSRTTASTLAYFLILWFLSALVPLSLLVVAVGVPRSVKLIAVLFLAS